MKKEDPTDKASLLSDREEQLMHAFFDGELTGPQLELMRIRAAAEDVQVKAAHADFKSLRSSLREFVELERIEGERRMGAVSLWESIESELGDLPPVGRTALLGEWLKGLVEQWNPVLALRPDSVTRWIRPPAFVAAFAAALLVFFSGLGTNFLGKPSGLGTNVALVTDSAVSSQENGLQGRQSSIPVVALTGSRSVDRYSGFHGSVPLAGSKTQRAPFMRDVPLRMDSGQLIGETPVNGGLRTDGLDIEWIKTNRPFKILPSTSRKAPPVIWVARGAR